MLETGESSSDAVRRFVAAVGSSPEQASFFLEAAGGDLERAVELYAGKPTADGKPCLHLWVDPPAPLIISGISALAQDLPGFGAHLVLCLQTRWA